MEGRRGGEAHGDAADLAARGAARAGGGAVDVGQHGFGVGQERAAGVGQRHATRMAHEQLGVDLALQRLDLLAERRLLHVELLRRPRDVALAGDGDEVAEMAQFHGFVPRLPSVQRGTFEATGKVPRFAQHTINTICKAYLSYI